MGFLKLNGLKSLLTVMLSIGFALTVQADDDDKDKEIQGPTIEVCKSKKDGTEKCKTKELHGQKAIIFLHEEQQQQAGAIETNEGSLSGLSLEVEGLSGKINTVRSEIPTDQQIIDAALSDPLIIGAIEAIPQLSERIDGLEEQVEAVESAIVGLEERVAALESLHSETRFVAVGLSGVASHSTDGISWTASNHNNGNMSAVAYGNGRFVAVGNGVASYSTDGISWTASNHNNGNMLGVAYGNGRFVAVGDHQVASHSFDGISWTASNHNNGSMNDVTYANGRFVAVGDIGLASIW